ncbi:MAG: MFS transporter [Neisseriaceae bacterium]|nr:MFS transporter [Neisseriaceae bacterium]
MNNKHMALTRAALMFPLALVLFEFAVYIGNDLVQPAMLSVTRDFGVDASWAPSSMSAYLLGGAAVAWFLGPLSDRVGRRRVFLTGVVFFIVTCLLILLTRNIESFILLRFLQGTGLTVITAVGYAAIQEAFEERVAVKVMALMANVSLLAPLLGPILGAFMIEHISWHWGFVGIATLATVAFFGLKKYMPETVDLPNKNPPAIWAIVKDYGRVYRNPRFLALAVTGPMIGLPLMLWVALSPVMLVEDLGLSSMDYGLSQLPVFFGLILGNIGVMVWVDRLPLGRTIQIGTPIMLLGALTMLLGFAFADYVLWFMLVGMSLIAFGEGLCFAVLYRFALMSSDVAKGTVAAAMGVMVMLFYAGVIELVKNLFVHFGSLAFALVSVLLIALFFTFPRATIKRVMAQRAKGAAQS